MTASLESRVPGAETASVVVCTYSSERWRTLAACIASVHAQSRPPDELLVVVDHNDELRTRIVATFPSVTVLANQAAERGPGGARTAGMAHAHGSIVAFIDDDARAEPSWLETIIDAFDDSQVMIVGSHVMPQWETNRPPWFPDEFDWVVGCSYRGQTAGADVTVVRNVIANGMAARRATLEAGGFRTDLGRLRAVPLGCEETEWCIRVARHFAGATVLQLSSAVLVHSVPDARTSVQRFLRHCYAEGLSKALVASSVGSTAALASERRYVARTLPSGFAKRLVQAAKGDRWALAQAAAIVAGLSVTIAGYIAGRVLPRHGLGGVGGDQANARHDDANHPMRSRPHF